MSDLEIVFKWGRGTYYIQSFYSNWNKKQVRHAKEGSNEEAVCNCHGVSPAG